MKKLIFITNIETQEDIYKEYNIKVPLYMTFDTEDKFWNSPLWFEMWSDKEYINR